MNGRVSSTLSSGVALVTSLSAGTRPGSSVSVDRIAGGEEDSGRAWLRDLGAGRVK